jgi:CheY-like chemotaxis protein
MQRILVIEDEEPIREVIVEFLEVEGFETLGAENGTDGIELAQNLQPDLIICDILMVGVDGYAVLAALQQEPKTAAIPFIFLTAKVGEAAMQQGLALGADDYLEKPIRIADLLKAITTQMSLPRRRLQSD